MILPKNGSSFGSFFRTVKNNKKYPRVDACRNLNPHCSDNGRRFVIIPFTMLMYASNRKQEIERRHHNIPNKRNRDQKTSIVEMCITGYGIMYNSIYSTWKS